MNIADLSQIGSALANAKVITHGRYRMGELKTDETTMTNFTQDQYLVGGQIRLGSNSLHLGLEGAYVHEDRKDGFDDQSYAKFSANVGFRLSNNTWFAFTVGTTDGKKNDDSIFALGKLKYAFTTQKPFDE